MLHAVQFGAKNRTVEHSELKWCHYRPILVRNFNKMLTDFQKSFTSRLSSKF